MYDHLVAKIADNTNRNSLSHSFRKKRLLFFQKLITNLEKPIKILDVGGTEKFWEMMDFLDFKDIEITLLNLNKINISLPYFKSISGDARHMPQFKDKEFDIIFSNSVIEHVGSYEDQKKMAMEVRRVGKRYFLQTPNRYFPIEPHFLFPFFQFLPLKLRVFLLMNFNLGFYKKVSDYNLAIKIITSINLLNKKKLLQLFPESKIHEEKALFFTKSFIIYNGWE